MHQVDPKEIRELLENIILSKNIPPKSREAVRAERIIRITSGGQKEYFWIFRGKNRDYILIPGYSCTCKDFIIHVVSEKARRPCYHLIAQKVAEKEGKYVDLNVEDGLVDDILLEILWNNYSPTLRRILIARTSKKRNS